METTGRHTSRSVVRNVAFGAATWVIPLVLGIVATPVIVRNLGVESYGIYALVLGLIGYTFSFGVGRAMTKYIAEYRLNGDEEGVRQVIGATLSTALFVAALGGTVMFFGAGVLADSIFRIAPELRADAVQGIQVAALIIFGSIFNQAFGAALQGIHRFDLFSKLTNASSIVQIGGVAVLAWTGYGLVTLLVWSAGVVALSSLAGMMLVRRFLPEARITLRTSARQLRLVLAFSAATIGYQVLGNALVLFERGWLTRTQGAEDVAYYVIAFTPGLYLQGFVGSLALTLLPMVSEEQGRADNLLAIYKKATRLVTVLVFLLVTILVVGSGNILYTWIGPEVAENGTTMLIILSVSFGILAIQGVSWQMKEGLGVPRYNLFASAAAFLTGIPAMVLMTRSFGAEGMAAGRLTAFTVMAFSILHFERWLFGGVQLSFWARLLSGCTAAALIAGAVQLLVANATPPGWPSLLASTAAGSVAFVTISWVLGIFSVEEKAQVRRALRLAA